jgi:clan AA aspartic protease (TIGR02281 family)
MKKQLLAFGLLFSSLAYAQNDAVTNAFFFNKDGELDKAKVEIDKAAVHEKTSGKAKTWYFRGMIYENILVSAKPQFAGLAPDAGKQAYESYAKAMSLSSKGEEYFDQSQSRINNLWGSFLNDGVKKYEAKDFAGSITSYELAQTIKPSDTIAFVYALYSAESLKDYEKCKTFTFKLFSMGKQQPFMYLSLARQARMATKNQEALGHVEDGRKVYPADKDLANEELELYFVLGRGNEAKSKIEEAIKMDSTRADLYSILGNMYDQESLNEKRPKKDRDASKAKALLSYKKALSLDPNNLESCFNLGVYYFNRGAEILKKVNQLDINTYQKSGKKMEGDALSEFKLALPYFESAYLLKPKDEGVINSLKNTYERIGRSSDAEKVGSPDFKPTQKLDLGTIATTKEIVGSKSSESLIVVTLKPKGGVYEIEVKMNGIPLNVIFDSGASDLSISLAEAMVMRKQGTIRDADILGEIHHSNAQGEITVGTKINIRELIIGGLVLKDVEASVVNNLGAPLLLGQSVLKRFGKIEIDNNNKVLILK